MYYVSSIRNGKIGITDSKDDVEEFYRSDEVLAFTKSGIKIRGVKNDSINLYTVDCDLEFTLNEFIEDEDILVLDIKPNDRLKKLASCIYPSVSIDDFFGTELIIKDSCILKFTSLEGCINEFRFGSFVFYRDMSSYNLYLPYSFSAREYGRIQEIINKCVKEREVKELKLLLSGHPVTYRLDGYNFNRRLLTDGNNLIYNKDKFTTLICNRAKFENIVNKDWQMDLNERNIDRETSLGEYLENQFSEDYWIPHYMDLVGCKKIKSR